MFRWAVLLRAAVRRRPGPDHAAYPQRQAALEAAFEQAVADGCEGLVCKTAGPDAVCQAGTRGWQSIKLKRDYRTELSDTVDLLVVGAFAGGGRRAGVYGAVLLAAPHRAG
jgi:DNA ligase-1